MSEKKLAQKYDMSRNATWPARARPGNRTGLYTDSEVVYNALNKSTAIMPENEESGTNSHAALS